MTMIDKHYQPQLIEPQCYQTWEKNGYFAPSGQGTPYCIMLPPPNVTGSLHMGHGFGFSLMDILVRYQRMCGKNTLWQPGTDHAGIATQMVVERRLHLTGETRLTLGRDPFVKKVWEWKKKSGHTITNQLRRLGASLDWQRECFTMDPSLSYAVREVFIRLYEEGLIYRGKRLVNWDPALLTAISDIEVINQEEEGRLWYIRYPLVQGSRHIVVATTRPETLLGDVAVAVHPEDERYQSLIGQHVKLPLTTRTIPIIADADVDPTFGTGCVKITPAHDFNDYVIGNRHHFTPINILTPDAHLNDEVPMPYRGMERFQARTQIVKELQALKLMEKIDPHTLKVPRGDRSGAIIEPYLTYQWYIQSKPLAEPAIRAVEKGDIRFIPEHWSKTYFQWMHHIEDWCISRQLWWGHRIPVWYDTAGNTYVGHDEPSIRQRYQLGAEITLTQDEDVLDTWVSAALWPFSTLGWPQQTTALTTFFPTNVLVTGFDIIFFWVARMVMMSLKFTQQVPFRDVYITGLIRDAEGQKMSKTKGNVLDPIDLIDGIALDDLLKKRLDGLMQPAMAKKIEQITRQEFPDGIPSFGTDALRFTFCSLASYTREIRFDLHRLTGYRNFCNKLWNASRYVIMHTNHQERGSENKTMTVSLPDRWIISCLQKTIRAVHTALAQYRFDLLAQTLYDFTWNEYCDWYLELSKVILTAPHSPSPLLYGTRHTLVHVLETLLRLLHPIMPFITEALWQRIVLLTSPTPPHATIMLASYPQANVTLIDEEAEQALAWIKSMVMAIRAIRSEMNIAPGRKLSVLLRHGTPADLAYHQQHQALIVALAKLESIDWLTTDTPPSSCVTTFMGPLEILIPMAEYLNQEQEITRLKKEIEKLQKDLLRVTNKLQNPQFIQNAPTEVVAKERARHAELQATLAKMESKLLFAKGPP